MISEEPGGPREIPLPGQGPADWRDIDELRTVSGTRIYRVCVTRGSNSAALAGAELVLGEIGGSKRAKKSSDSALSNSLFRFSHHNLHRNYER